MEDAFVSGIPKEWLRFFNGFPDNPISETGNMSQTKWRLISHGFYLTFFVFSKQDRTEKYFFWQLKADDTSVSPCTQVYETGKQCLQCIIGFYERRALHLINTRFLATHVDVVDVLIDC